MTTRYFISRCEDGSILHLVRIHDTEQKLWGEYFQDGRWIEHGSAMDYLLDGRVGESVPEEEAMEIIRGLGAKISSSGG